MKIQILFPNFINVSAENFTKIKNFIDSYNQDGQDRYDNYSVTSKPLKDFINVIKTSNTTYKTKDLDKVGGWPFNDPSKEVQQEFSEYFEERVEGQINNTINPNNETEFVFRIYSNDQELEEYNREIEFFLKTVESINTEYSKFISDPEVFIDRDGEIKNLKNGNDILRKLRAYKFILRLANIRQGNTPSPTPSPTPTPTPGPQASGPDRDKALEIAIWFLRDSNNIYTKNYMVDRYGSKLISEKITKEEFDMMQKPEYLNFLLNNLEPGEVKYILVQFVKDNPSDQSSHEFEMLFNTGMSEEDLADFLKNRKPGLSDDAYLKLAKAIKAEPIEIAIPGNLPPKPTNPPVPPPPSQGGTTPPPSQGGGSGTPPPPAQGGSTPPPASSSGSGAPTISPGPEKADLAPTRRPQTAKNPMEPVSRPGGPTYYVRISSGRYRPAIQADMAANIPLFIKNPNPVAAAVNPYVRVADEVKKARRAGPVDQSAMDKEMSAQGYQKIGPGGLRREADGSIRRKSQFGGAVGSLSNFLGDVGNSLKKKSR